MTTSWSRSPLRPLRYSVDNVNTHHKLSKCCRWRCQSFIIRLQLNYCQNLRFECAILLISFTEVVGCILPPRLSQLLSFICFCQNLSVHRFTILLIVPITQPGSSSSLSLPHSVSLSYSSFPSSPSSELARSLRLSPIVTSISSNVFSGSLYVNPAISACFLLSCSCWNAASASSTRFLATAVSLTT